MSNIPYERRRYIYERLRRKQLPEPISRQQVRQTLHEMVKRDGFIVMLNEADLEEMTLTLQCARPDVPVWMSTQYDDVIQKFQKFDPKLEDIYRYDGI